MTQTVRPQWAYTAAELGRAISDARKEIGLTQADLAERLGVTRSTVNRLEQGAAVSIATAAQALSECGRAIVVVPKRAKITVTVYE